MIWWQLVRKFLGSRLGLGLVGALLLGLALWRAHIWHEGRIEAARLEVIAKRDREWQDAFANMRLAAAAWKSKFEAAQHALATTGRLTHETDLRRVAGDADTLRLQGPGRAQAGAGCRSGADPRSGTGAGRYHAATAQPDASGPGLPAPDREGESAPQFAVVPWGWLVQRAEEHDALLSEAQAWRRSDAGQRALLLDGREELRRKLEDIKPELSQSVGPD